MWDDLLQVRMPALNFYVLKDAQGLYLLDTGFIGGRAALRRVLKKRGWEREQLRGIILTHGHLDHILNAAPLARASGAWIAAPLLDAEHYLGTPHYRGWSRVAGVLEALGRPLLRFEPFTPQRWVEEGSIFDLWHGLRAIHLPGHTAGHMGYYCEKLKLLFSADLVLSQFGRAWLPPAFLNNAGSKIPASIDRALALDLEGILPNHCCHAAPEEHLRRLRALAVKTAQEGP